MSNKNNDKIHDNDDDQARWDKKYAQQLAAEDTDNKDNDKKRCYHSSEPSKVLLEIHHLLKPDDESNNKMKALDLAGGSGRNSIWLAKQGWDVTIADISPIGLNIAQTRARDANVYLETIQTNLRTSALPHGPWDLIICVAFLSTDMFQKLPSLLSSNGKLVIIQATKKNLERRSNPPARYLIEEGTLCKIISGIKILHYKEGWSVDGRHDAVLVAERE